VVSIVKMLRLKQTFLKGYKMPVFIDTQKSKKITAKDLKDMELHDMKDLGRVHILRVWGGWIYWSFEASKVASAVFVPQEKSQQSES